MNLENIAKEIRKTIIKLANSSKSPHVGSCLSYVDILVALYFHKLNLITKYPQVDYICIDEPEIRLATHDKYGQL